MLKGASADIAQTHSHQQVLTKYVFESMHLVGLNVFVLDQETFPSGQAYHENKKLVTKVIERTFRPYVFHMCWTDNRVNKVVYFKETKLWFLPDEMEGMCVEPKLMLDSVIHPKYQFPPTSIRDRCCQRTRYWPKEVVSV